jgi:hypothetical protein
MFTYIPRNHSNLSKVESAFITPGGDKYGVAVGLGAKSRATECYENYSDGMCWGKFSGENSKFLNTSDTPIGCMLQSKRVLSASFDRIPQESNMIMQSGNSPPKPQISGCNHLSDGNYRQFCHRGCSECNVMR